jgi:hypothetical protein
MDWLRNWELAMPAYEIVVKVEFDRVYYFEADSPEQAMEIYKSGKYDADVHGDFSVNAGDFEEQPQTAATPVETADAKNWLEEMHEIGSLSESS